MARNGSYAAAAGRTRRRRLEALPAETVERIERALVAGPAPVTVLTYDDAGHAFDNPLPDFHHPQASRHAWDNTVTWLSRTAPTT